MRIVPLLAVTLVACEGGPLDAASPHPYARACSGAWSEASGAQGPVAPAEAISAHFALEDGAARLGAEGSLQVTLEAGAPVEAFTPDACGDEAGEVVRRAAEVVVRVGDLVFRGPGHAFADLACDDGCPLFTGALSAEPSAAFDAWLPSILDAIGDAPATATADQVVLTIQAPGSGALIYQLQVSEEARGWVVERGTVAVDAP